MASAALRRVTELFVEGRECVLDEQEPVLVWVNKLNPFEVDEARKDGAAARTRFTLALEDPRSEESQLFDLQAARVEDETVAMALAQTKYNEDMIRASDDIRADEAWHDKINVLDRAELGLADRPADDPERQAVDKLSLEYFEELRQRTDSMREQRVADLLKTPHDELRALYRKTWIDEQGSQAFLTQYRITELWLAIRECNAVKGENGRWDHGTKSSPRCDHRVKLLDEREEVTKLPEGLVNAVRPIITALAVDERLAKGSAGSPSSSDSSARPNEQEDSQQSGQTVTSPEPETTSTKP